MLSGKCYFLPVIDAPECLFKLAQDFGGRGPLHMPAVILHGSDIFEAPVDLADVGLDLVASVGPQDDEGRSHPPVSHSGYGAPPHLETHKKIKMYDSQETYHDRLMVKTEAAEAEIS